MSPTERLIKEPIRALLRTRSELIHAPDDGPDREYPLVAGDDGRHFRADWAFHLVGGGRLFIEDDDAARALHNVTKYWMWMSARDVRERVHLVHLVGPGASDLAEFVGRRIQAERGSFRYYLLRVADWDDADTWTTALARVLDSLAEPTAGDGMPDTPGRLVDEPAVGMWRNRGDLGDGSAYVHALRETDWNRSRP